MVSRILVRALRMRSHCGNSDRIIPSSFAASPGYPHGSSKLGMSRLYTLFSVMMFASTVHKNTPHLASRSSRSDKMIFATRSIDPYGLDTRISNDKLYNGAILFYSPFRLPVLHHNIVVRDVHFSRHICDGGTKNGGEKKDYTRSGVQQFVSYPIVRFPCCPAVRNNRLRILAGISGHQQPGTFRSHRVATGAQRTRTLHSSAAYIAT
jgi:hypothetical protein